MDYLTLALILFTVGVILLLAEILLPTGGILVVVALLFFALGVGILLSADRVTEAVIALVGLAIGLPAAGYVIVSAWRKMSLGTVLPEEVGAGAVPIPGQLELAALKNRIGKTVSPMRPSGTIEIDGRRIDAMTEGVMLDAGVWVRCIGVRGTTVVVRQIEPPADMSDLSSDAVPAPASPDRSRELRPPASPPPPPPRDDFDLDLGLDK
jgi:membrane-bound serine protease (ClpP class)